MLFHSSVNPFLLAQVFENSEGFENIYKHRPSELIFSSNTNIC